MIFWSDKKIIKFYLIKLATNFKWQPSYLEGQRSSLQLHNYMAAQLWYCIGIYNSAIEQLRNCEIVQQLWNCTATVKLYGKCEIVQLHNCAVVLPMNLQVDATHFGFIKIT